MAKCISDTLYFKQFYNNTTHYSYVITFADRHYLSDIKAIIESRYIFTHNTHQTTLCSYRYGYFSCPFVMLTKKRKYVYSDDSSNN